MQRFLAAFIALFFLLTGAAFATSHEGDTVTVRGKTAVVRVASPTRLVITADGQEWTYKRSGRSFVLLGPEGGDMWFASDVLDEWLRQHPEWGRPGRTGDFWGELFIGLGIGVIGLLHLLNPRLAWYLGDGWKFRDAEPSDLALGLVRLGGALGIVVGLVVMLRAG